MFFYYNKDMKKKIVLTSIIIGAVLLSSLATFLITSTVIKKQNEDKYNSAVQLAFQLHYEGRVALFEEENKHASNVDAVFLGDSLTESYDLKTFYPEYNVYNRGIGGDTTFGVEKRLKVSVYDAHPKVTAMLIGANNFKTMFDNYENILINFKENAPEMKVILLSLTSMTKNWGRNNEIAKKNNEKIKEYANKYQFTYVDLFNPLLDETTNALKEEYTTDGGHLTNAGYQVVTDTIKPVLSSLLA